LDRREKTDPANSPRIPVIFVTESSRRRDRVFAAIDRPHGRRALHRQIAAWLWFTVLFANFAEAVAEDAARRRPTRCAAPAAKHTPSG